MGEGSGGHDGQTREDQGGEISLCEWNPQSYVAYMDESHAELSCWATGPRIDRKHEVGPRAKPAPLALASISAQ